jgi:aspartyl-tRNA synthetase
MDLVFSPLPPWPRTHYCGAMRLHDAGREVALWGWVAARRDHGGLIFIDLRDREGSVQLVFNPERNPAAHEVARGMRMEYYVAVRGEVVRRTESTVNAQIPTGAIEVSVVEAKILNPSLAPPFPLGEGETGNEEVRLRYRYLDLRRPEMQRNLRRRHRAVRAVRVYLDEAGFVEIETPILWRPTPEGARDYLVPSRVNPGKFYALPQSPQLLKQLLMISGYDRYYQIARCFRDEDLRANRQPEFSQIDLEMTCPRPDDIIALVEGMLAGVYRQAAGIEVPLPFPRLTYAEAIDRFGSDKPDLRFDLELKRLDEAFAGTGFKVFAEALARGESIYGIRVPANLQFSRRELDEIAEGLKVRQGLGLAWAKTRIAGLAPDDTLLMVAGLAAKVRPTMGELRLQLGDKFGLRKSEELRFLWVIEFPLFECSEQERRLVSVNHPFTAPHPDDLEYLSGDPLKARALAYDVVLNGEEMGGGSIRIHNPELQMKAFELLGFGREEATEKFGFLLEALSYGAPPHGGIALGVDRLAMMLCHTDSLRDVIAFPKTQRAVDLMTGAPSDVDPRQLRELSIKVAK